MTTREERTENNNGVAIHTLARRINDELARKEKEVAKLKATYNALANSAQTDLFEIAELLHSKECHMSHDDQCSWGYEESGNGNWDTHKQWLEHAAERIGAAGVDTVTYLAALKVVMAS